MSLTDYIDPETAAILERWQRLLPNRLARAWLEIASDRGNIPRAQILTGLNEQAGTQYTLHRLSDWLNGHRPIPREIADRMRCEVLNYLFAEGGDLLAAILDIACREPLKVREPPLNE